MYGSDLTAQDRLLSKGDLLVVSEEKLHCGGSVCGQQRATLGGNSEHGGQVWLAWVCPLQCKPYVKESNGGNSRMVHISISYNYRLGAN